MIFPDASQITASELATLLFALVGAINLLDLWFSRRMRAIISVHGSSILVDEPGKSTWRRYVRGTMASPELKRYIMDKEYLREVRPELRIAAERYRRWTMVIYWPRAVAIIAFGVAVVLSIVMR